MNKIILTLCGLAVGALFGGYFFAGGTLPSAGGTSNYDTLGVTALQVGSGCNDGLGTCTGTTINNINLGNCVIAASANTISASSSAGVECAATGVTEGDSVVVTVATTSALSLYSGLTITGISASSTSGYITLKLFNGTGGTFTWSTIASTTGFQYRVIGF